MNVAGKSITLGISGLQENMPEAVRMLEDFMLNMKPDTAVYNQYVEQVMKGRMETRTNQNACYNALVNYGLYGAHNPVTDAPSPAMLRGTEPKVYTDLLKGLSGMKHQVLYWGPATMKEVSAIVSKHHRTPK